jgi:hypothetical protein
LSPICSTKVNARTILHLVKVTWITAADTRMPGIFFFFWFLSHVVQAWAFGQESCQCDPAEECMIAESRPLGIMFWNCYSAFRGHFIFIPQDNHYSTFSQALN